MYNFNEIVRYLRTKHGWSQGKLEMLAGLNNHHVSMIESRTTIPRGDTVSKIARAFGMTSEELLHYDIEKDATSFTVNEKPIANYLDDARETLRRIEELVEKGGYITTGDCVRIPLRGTVPAGIPWVEEETTGEYAEIPRLYLKNENIERLYALRIAGDSLMGDGILSGDVIVVDSGQTDIIDGKIYVVRIGNEVCCRHVHKRNDHLRLVSSNGEYRDIRVREAEILGRAIQSIRKTEL